jgi:hypothetical protein
MSIAIALSDISAATMATSSHCGIGKAAGGACSAEGGRVCVTGLSRHLTKARVVNLRDSAGKLFLKNFSPLQRTRWHIRLRSRLIYCTAHASKHDLAYDQTKAL